MIRPALLQGEILDQSLTTNANNQQPTTNNHNRVHLINYLSPALVRLSRDLSVYDFFYFPVPHTLETNSFSCMISSRLPYDEILRRNQITPR